MRQPTLQCWTWSRTMPQFAVMVLLIAVCWQLFPLGDKVLAVISAAAVYLIYSQTTRRILTSKHRRGIKEATRKNYDESTRYFRESVEFFSSHSRLDKYRSVLLLTPSAWTYQEMGLISIASNYAAQGDVESAAKTLKQLLSLFPENEYAEHSLGFIRAASGASEA